LVRTPRDPDALPLLRALPSARWRADLTAWQCSAEPADLPRVLEIAARLSLQIPPELIAAAAVGSTTEQAAASRADTAGLYPHQREGVRFLARRQRALLADDMGVGKTAQALCALPEAGRALIVCPNVVKGVWRTEARRWRPDLRVTVLSGRGSFRVPEVGEIVVINYDLLPKAPRAAKGEVPTTLPFDLAGVSLVVDEAHMVKNYKAARTQAVAALARQCSTAWLLTGTPLANRALDLWGVLGAGGMEREVFGSWSTFTRLFDAYRSKWGGWEFGAPAPEVPERLRRVMLRRTKAEVLPDLPEVTYTDVEVNDLSRDLVRDLDRAWDDWDDDIIDGGRRLPRFEEFSALRARLAAARIPAAIELVEQYEEQGVPVLLFSAHRAPVDTFGAREGWAAITGDTPAAQRTEIVERFQAGQLRGLALTIAAGGVGITLTRASTAIFVDLAWRPADNWQAEDRMRRIGQTAAKIEVVRMVFSHPLDRYVQALLAEKIRLIRAAVEATAVYRPPSADATSATWIEESDEALQARIAAALAAAEAEAAEGRRERAGTRITDRLAADRARGAGRATPDAPEAPVVLTAEQRAAVVSAYDALLAVCDGASSQDGAGFNKPDQAVVHWLDLVNGPESSDEAMELTWRLVRRYQRQVRNALSDELARLLLD
jgi:SNF2 family DNA or RNA helicase